MALIHYGRNCLFLNLHTSSGHFNSGAFTLSLRERHIFVDFAVCKSSYSGLAFYPNSQVANVPSKVYREVLSQDNARLFNLKSSNEEDAPSGKKRSAENKNIGINTGSESGLDGSFSTTTISDVQRKSQTQIKTSNSEKRGLLLLGERLTEGFGQVKRLTRQQPVKKGERAFTPADAPVKKVWRKGETAFTPTDASGRPLTLVEESALINDFVRRLRLLPVESSTEAVAPLVKETGLSSNLYRSTLILKQLGAAYAWEHALLLVKWMEGEAVQLLRPDTYAMLFRILAEAGQFSQVVDIYYALRCKGGTPPLDYQNLLRIFGQGGCLEAALEVLEDLKSRGLQPSLSAYNHAINAAAAGGACFEAETLLEELREAGLGPDSVTYGKMIEVMGRGGRWKEAVAYFERYLGAGFAPTVATYKHLLQALAKAGQAESAEKYLEKMKGSGLAPTAACYSAVACAHAAAGDWRKGVQVLREVPSDAEGKRTLVVSHTALIQALGKAGRVKDILDVLEHMNGEKGCKPNAVTYSTVVAALARSGDIAEAEAVLEEMNQQGFQSDIRTWGFLLDACARKALHQKVRQLLLDMKRAGCDPDTKCLESLVRAYATDGKVREGLELLQGFRSKGLPVREGLYAALLEACKGEDVALTKEVWADLTAHQGTHPTPRLCTAFLKALFCSGASAGALSFFDELRSSEQEPDAEAYALAIEAVGCSGIQIIGQDETVEVREGLRRELATEEEQERDVAVSHSSDRTVESSDGAVAEVEASIEEHVSSATSAALIASGPERCSRSLRTQDPYASRESESQCSDEDLDAQISDGRGNSDSVTSAVFGHKKQNPAFIEARELYAEALQRQPSKKVFLALLKVCRRFGEVREALEVPDQMHAAGLKPDTQIYNAILLICSSTANWAAGVKVKQKMLNEGVKADVYTYNLWISSAARCCKSEAALSAFEEMQGLELKPTLVTWTALIGALGGAGKWRDALERFRGLPEGMTPSDITYSTVVRALARAGRLEEGLGVLDEMQSAGFQADVRLYDLLAEDSFEQKRWTLFLELLQAAEKQGLTSNSQLLRKARWVRKKLAKEERKEASESFPERELSEATATGDPVEDFAFGRSEYAGDVLEQTHGEEEEAANGESSDDASDLVSSASSSISRVEAKNEPPEDIEETARKAEVGSNLASTDADRSSQLRTGVNLDSSDDTQRLLPERRKRQKRAKTKDPNMGQWIRYTGRPTGQELVKLLDAARINRRPLRDAQKDARYLRRMTRTEED